VPASEDLAIVRRSLDLLTRLGPVCARSVDDELFRGSMRVLREDLGARTALLGHLAEPGVLVVPALETSPARGPGSPPALRLPAADWPEAWARALETGEAETTTATAPVPGLPAPGPHTVACAVIDPGGPIGLAVVAGRDTAFTTLETQRFARAAGFLAPFLRAFVRMDAAFRERGAREAQLARIESELRKSERRFKELADLLPQTVFEIDLGGRFLYVNRRGFAFSGYDEADLARGITVRDVLHPDDRQALITNLRARLEGAPDTLRDYRMLRKTGEEVPIRVHSSPILADGIPVGLRGVIVDLSEVRRVQELAYRAQRLETAGRVAGQVAHDFNNLLGPLVAYPELLRRLLPEDHPGQRFADAMLESALRLSEISQQLLALGRRGNYAQGLHDLNTTVNEALLHIAPRPPTLEVVVELEPELMPVLGGAAQLLRVVTNLIANARQAMQDRGRLLLQTENVYLDRATGSDRAVPRGEYVRLIVADTGPGIPEADRARIFDPFFTTKPAGLARGSGLGLSSVHAIVEDHRGYVDFDTEPGQGTCFFVYLPVHRASALPPHVEGDELVGGNEQVLVVDDDARQREVARTLLETLGYTVDAVASGEEALRSVATSRPDLLLLDMILPEGMDGADTYARALELAPALRAVVVTGHARSDRLAVALRLGAHSVVQKPLTLRSLGRAVRQALHPTGQRHPVTE
jgi:two-component system cell cycle sensor histidine kinase/response regulator CckA